jgi:hypothetical protein
VGVGVDSVRIAAIIIIIIITTTTTEVGIARWCSDGLRTGRSGFNSQQGRESFLLHSDQTGSGADPDSCSMGTGGSFLGGKAAGA